MLEAFQPVERAVGLMLMHWMAGFSSFSRRVTPMNVPLVPRPATKCVTRPSVCRQISIAVVS